MIPHFRDASPASASECPQERGQAMIEAMIGVIVIGAFVAGTHAAGRWHSKSVDALQSSAAEGFLRSMGKRPGIDLPEFQSHHVPIASSPEQLSGHRVADRLRREWNIDSPGPITTAVAAAPKSSNARLPVWVPQTEIVRHFHVIGGTGHGYSDRQAQAHVGTSRTAWASAALRSSEIVRLSGERLHPVDVAWRRSAPDSDWLSRWAGYVPARLLKRGTQ